MKKILISFLFLCTVSGFLFAQDTITIYYDNNWVEISNNNDAVYYGKAFQESKNVWKVHDYYMSNKIQMTGAYKSKKLTTKNGHFTYYFENGNKTSEGNYIDDKLEGLWNYWFESGEKKSEGEYSDGEKTGVWYYWYPNSKLKSKGTYKKVGSYAYEGFYENGITNAKGNITNGKPQGMWVYWNSDGRKTLQGNFNNGLREGEWTRFFRDGEMKLLLKNGISEGKQLGGIVRNE
jgi:antitoxin component YwqK of YwqJK toxin-antitoxin module